MESITSKEEHMLMFLFQLLQKHISFNKGEYVGHLQLPVEEIQQIPEDPGSLTTHSISTERMMAEKVGPDTFKPSCHKLQRDIETKLEELLKE